MDHVIILNLELYDEFKINHKNVATKNGWQMRLAYISWKKNDEITGGVRQGGAVVYILHVY